MTTRFSRILPILIVATLAGAAETTPAPTTPQPEARIENAPEGFPLSLQGFFGKGAEAEVSLREKSTGKSAWLKPGDTFGEWKLESTDAESGRVVLTAGKRRVTLRQAGETPAETDSEEKTGTRKLKSREESVVWKKFDALKQDKKINDLAEKLIEQSKDILRKSHPEYFGKDGRFYEEKPGAIISQAAEMKRLLDADSSPEATMTRPLLTAILDAVERTKPLATALPSESTREELDAEQVAVDKRLATPMSDEQRAKVVEEISSARTAKNDRLQAEKAAEILRMYEEADRLYLERNVGK